jgi:DNA-binding NtrC family response regulator
VLLELLRSRGWRVYATGRGQEAIELARRVPLDFSILDLHLPGTTGVEVLRTISREVRPLPSILMSGAASHEEAAAAVDLGVFTFLRKPLDLESLRASLDRLIQCHFGKLGGGPPAPP